MVFIFTIIALVVGFVGFFIGCLSVKPPDVNVVELSDTMKANAKRTGKQVLQDGVMQLKNEIAASGAVSQEKLGDGNIRVTLKVVV